MIESDKKFIIFVSPCIWIFFNLKAAFDLIQGHACMCIMNFARNFIPCHMYSVTYEYSNSFVFQHAMVYNPRLFSHWNVGRPPGLAQTQSQR